MLCCAKVVASDDILYHNTTTITEDVYSYLTPFLPHPALYVKWSIDITFPKAVCCPILKTFSVSPELYKVIFNFTDRCFTTDYIGARSAWDKGHGFILNTKNGTCSFGNESYHCTIDSQDMSYEPKTRWMVFSYFCGQARSLQGLQFTYTAKVRNTTKCEQMQAPNFGCDEFYQFTAFPDVFGATSQEELKSYIPLIKPLAQNNCYKYLHYVLCQVIFPQCPNGTTQENNIVDHLTTICVETCKDLLKGCAKLKELAQLEHITNCNYYTRNGEQNKCIRLHVTCGLPPRIANGDIKDGLDFNVTYRPGSTVQYNCHSDFELVGNETSTCEFSGNWTSPPRCIKKPTSIRDKYIKGTVAAGVSALVLISVTISALCVRRRKQEQRRIKNYFENQPTQKRKRNFDCFVSMAEDDHKFARNVLQPELEVNTDPPLKLLIHSRDFSAGTLILVNIQNAVNNSNSAIILMSQAYIDSRWCRDEFEVCMIAYATARRASQPFCMQSLMREPNYKQGFRH